MSQSESVFFGQARVEALLASAAASPRKRSHLLLHAGHEDLVQRLLIAAQPGTYVRPHKHSEQWELLTVLRGELDLLLFRDDTVVQRCRMNSSSPVAQIEPAMWHTCVVNAPNTLLLEVKPGPYHPN